MFRLLGRLRRNQQGGAIIEYAVVFPVFLMVFFSILELGLIAYADALMDTLSTQVARWAKTGYDYSEGSTYSFEGTDNEGWTPNTSTDYYSVDNDGNVIMDGREGWLREWLRGTAGRFLDPKKLTISSKLYASMSDIGSNNYTQGTPYQMGEGMEAMVYTVSYDWSVMSPILFVFFGETTKLSTSVVVMNEAF